MTPIIVVTDRNYRRFIHEKPVAVLHIYTAIDPPPNSVIARRLRWVARRCGGLVNLGEARFGNLATDRFAIYRQRVIGRFPWVQAPAVVYYKDGLRAETVVGESKNRSVFKRIRSLLGPGREGIAPAPHGS